MVPPTPLFCLAVGWWPQCGVVGRWPWPNSVLRGLYSYLNCVVLHYSYQFPFTCKHEHFPWLCPREEIGRSLMDTFQGYRWIEAELQYGGPNRYGKSAESLFMCWYLRKYLAHHLHRCSIRSALFLFIGRGFALAISALRVTTFRGASCDLHSLCS